MARVYNFSAGPAVLPEEVLKDEMKWLSFSALMSPNRKPPLIMKVISQSALSSFDFFENISFNR